MGTMLKGTGNTVHNFTNSELNRPFGCQFVYNVML